MRNVTVTISQDFGNWSGIETFNWDLYEKEIRTYLCKNYDYEPKDVTVNFIESGQSEVKSNENDTDREGFNDATFNPEYDDELYEGIMNIDLTEDKFY
jgi:hypothetical protein